MNTTKGTLLIFSQAYPPDPASVGQHMHDAAAEMARRGWRVRVITANRGYDDASIKYDNREVRDGVEIRRVPFSSFGKASIPVRALAMCIFMCFCLFAGLFTRNVKLLLVTTSPPMCGFVAGLVHSLRRTPLAYWVMDLNPDQMIALGKMREKSLAARMLNAMQRFVCKRSRKIVVLDRFMGERLLKKIDVADRMTVMPPWPHEDTLELVEHEDNWFREKHGLNGRFVVMYSGNHAYSSPVDTVVDAAIEMQDDPDMYFMFIGGGNGKKDVERAIAEHEPKNIVSLPYQPFKDLRYSLSAADIHVVSVGDGVVGAVHPCKIYGAMAVARPILLVAPDPCHASEIIREQRVGWHIPLGDTALAIETLREIARTPKEELRAMGERAKAFIDRDMNMVQLRGAFCDILESACDDAH